MGLFHSPRIVTNGLSLCLDAGNPKSYPGSGTTWNDLSSSGNHATLINGVTYNSGGFMSLDGTNDYIGTSFNPNLNSNRLYTLETWFRDNSPGGFSDNTAIFTTYRTSTTAFMGLHIYSTGVIIFSERNTSSTLRQITSLPNVVDGNWKHIVITATSNNLLAYVNGQSVGTSPGSRSGGTITSGQTLTLGSNHLSRYQSANFAIFKMYLDNALSAQEVEQNFNALRGRFGV